MSDRPCTLREFDGCRCTPGQCQSVTVRLDAAVAKSLIAYAKRAREFFAFVTVLLLLMLFGAYAAEVQLSAEAKDMQEVFHAERL